MRYWFCLAFLLLGLATADGQERKLERFILSNSTLSESRAPLYIAQDLKLFEKFGLDAQIVNIRGSAINNAALMAGEIQMAVANGTIAITAAARGAPIVIVGTIGPTRYSLISRALTSLQQLKGKTIGIGGFGIGDYFVVRRLLPKLGLNPDKDVALLPTGTTSSFERINMMLSGKADAVMATKSNIDRVEMRGIKLNVLAGDGGIGRRSFRRRFLRDAGVLEEQASVSQSGVSRLWRGGAHRPAKQRGLSPRYPPLYERGQPSPDR